MPYLFGLENRNRARLRRQRSRRFDEAARFRHGEMRAQRLPVLPFFDEDETQRIFAVDMHRMRETAGLLARAADVFERLGAQFLKSIFARDETTCYDQHGLLPSDCFRRKTSCG